MKIYIWNKQFIWLHCAWVANNLKSESVKQLGPIFMCLLVSKPFNVKKTASWELKASCIFSRLHTTSGVFRHKAIKWDYIFHIVIIIRPEYRFNYPSPDLILGLMAVCINMFPSSNLSRAFVYSSASQKGQSIDWQTHNFLLLTPRDCSTRQLTWRKKLLQQKNWAYLAALSKIILEFPLLEISSFFQRCFW